MTWVVGANSIVGACYVIADTRVVWPDRPSQTLDVRKVHVLGNYVIGAFAGSVTCGFAAITVLQHEFLTLRATEAWELPIVANTWLPRVLQRTFALHATEARASQLSILLAALDPTQGNGLPGRLRTHVCVMRSPKFRPQLTSGLESVAIGSGAEVYRSALQGYSSSTEFHMMLNGSGPQLQATELARVMRDISAKRPTSTVGRHMHIGVVDGPSAKVGELHTTTYPKDAPPHFDAFPPICDSWSDYLQACADRGWIAAEACDGHDAD